VQYAEERGYLCYHVPDSRKVVMASESGAGFPDWVFCRRVVDDGQRRAVAAALGLPAPETAGAPRLIFAELKSGRRGAKASEAQQAWLAALQAAGAEAYLWYPSDWTEVQRVLH
jgi:hypothetical protein